MLQLKNTMAEEAVNELIDMLLDFSENNEAVSLVFVLASITFHKAVLIVTVDRFLCISQ